MLESIQLLLLILMQEKYTLYNSINDIYKLIIMSLNPLMIIGKKYNTNGKEE